MPGIALTLSGQPDQALTDRLPLDEKCAADLRNRFHDQHPNLGFHEHGS